VLLHPSTNLIFSCMLPVATALADLIYSQLSDPTYGPGMISAGFYTQAESLWKAGLGATIEREIARGCKSITIAGHSLGAAVAQLLAVRIEVSSGSCCCCCMGVSGCSAWVCSRRTECDSWQLVQHAV
jgi:pimeloyl-ACP methyl ester carboxylesterase